MDFANIKAAAVDIDVDDNLLTNELLSIPKDKWDIGTDSYSGHTWRSIFLTVNDVKIFSDFKSAKDLNHSKWQWDTQLNIPYIRSLVESLPIKTIGMIRAFVLEGPLVMHTDSNDSTPTELTYNLGLTIASKLQSSMIMPGCAIPEKYIFFNDSIPHGFPDNQGQQISIRVFGDFDYNKFKITKVYK